MGVLTVKTGPLAGRSFGSIQDMLDAQGEKRLHCKHERQTTRLGSAGKGTHFYHYSRTRCLDCNAVIDSHRI